MPVLDEGSLSSGLGLSQYNTIAPENFSGGKSITLDEQNAMAQRVYNRVNGVTTGMSAWEHIGRWGAGTAIDLADSVWSAPINPFGERGDVWSQASPEMQEYYQQNKGLIEGSSAVAGGIMTAIGAEVLVIPRLTAMLAESTALASSGMWLAGRGKSISSTRNMLMAQRAAAEAGESFSLMGNAAGRAYLANRAANATIAMTRTVPFEYAVMGSNEAFNTGEWGREGFFIGAAAVLGGAVGAAGARATTRMVANSPEIRNLRSSGIASAGVSNDMLAPIDASALARINPKETISKQSAEFTMFALASRSNTPGGYDAAASNATRSDTVRNEWQNEMFDAAQKMIQNGISGVVTDRQALKNLPEARYVIDELVPQDPFVMHGVDEIGIVQGKLTDVAAERTAHIESLWKQSKIQNEKGNTKEAMRLAKLQRVLKQQDGMVLLNGGWHDMDSEIAKAVAEFNPQMIRGQIELKALKMAKTDAVQVGLPTQGTVHLDAALTPVSNGRTINVEKLPIQDRLILNEAANMLIGKMSHANAPRFKLTEKSAKSWFALDLATELMSRGKTIEFDSKVLGKFQNVEDLKRESLRIKARGALAEAGELGRITPELRFKWNLPMATHMEQLEDSAGDGFRAFLNGAARDEGTAFELASALNDSRAFQGFDLYRTGTAELPKLDGDMLRFNRDKKGNWMRPMLGYFDRTSPIQKLSERGHANAMTLRKAERTAKLMAGDTHTNALARALAQMPELQQAMDILGLHNDQITGIGGGARQALGEAVPKRFRYRDNASLLAATKLQEATERHGMKVFKELMDSVGMQDLVTKITSSGHAAQRAQLDSYFSLRAGWDVDDVTQLDGGFFGFTLADSKSNRMRLGMTETEAWTPQLLKNERLNKPLVVDETALGVIQSYNQLTDGVRQADNALRSAKGLKDIEYRKFYTPPPNTNNAFVGFVRGPDGQYIKGRTIVAKSPDEYRTLVKRTLDELGNGHYVQTKDQLESLRDVWDEVAMDWIDPGVSSATAGIGQQTGGLTGAYIKQGAFNEALDWVKRKAIVQSQDTLKSLMQETLQVSRVHAAAERTIGGPKARTIYDEFEQALTGNSYAFRETSIVDKGFRKVEESINSAMANSALAAPVRWVTDLAQRMGMGHNDLTGAKTYKQIMEAMGPHTPFKHVNDYIESRGIKQPPTVKGMAQSLNTLAASVLLRWLEVPHALMNGLGLIATMPAVVASGRAPISTFVNVKGKNMGIVDGARMMADAMKDMFRNRVDTNADWRYMVDHGYSEQSVMEYHQALGAIQSQAGFYKWAKNIDKYVSIASDKSENWSRQISHFVGLKLADAHGIQGMASRHQYANEIASAMIADYAPINRPELFQSGFGSMIGLFQSYGLSQYSKMFRWMEKGDYSKMGIQAAMQASMFGMTGTYGAGQLMDLRDSMVATGSEPTAVDLIYEHFGPTLGGAIVHGGISELSQLAMWTRGDTNFRMPGMTGSLPALDVGTKVARGFHDAVQGWLNAAPGESTNAMLEAVQQNMPNRVMRSWMMALTNGKEIDHYGQTMVDTQGFMDIAARVVGVRSARQQTELEAYYAGKAAVERDSSKMEKVRRAFRSAVRNNKGNVEAVSPIQYFNDYVEAGGNPRQFKTWARNLLRDSDSPRAVKSLQQQLGSTRSALETWRFGAYGAYPVQ